MFPEHLTAVLAEGRAAIAARLARPVEPHIPARNLEYERRSAESLAEFIASARDNLAGEGVADYADFEGIASRWFPATNFVAVPIRIPGCEVIYVYFTRDEGRWVRTLYTFPGEWYGVGGANNGRYAETLGEALALAHK